MKTEMTLGIIGTGKMGSDIFTHIFEAEISVVVVCRSEERVAQLQKLCQKKVSRLIKIGAISQSQALEKLSKVTISTEIESVKDCSIIIESITGV
jgi:3-hydroxybutyryl-CoA dehydrogenase